MFLPQFIYIIAVIMCVCGLYMVISKDHYVAKIIGLAIFQNSILIFYIAIAKASSGIPPLHQDIVGIVYSSPLPHVLMLTAIVVGFATLSVALAIAYKIHKTHGTLKAKELLNL
jgi:multicomponent Na+:H+ antiporter subunit C